MQFAQLNEVDLRTVWAHEAHDFTKWLADNLEPLSEAIGIRMELEGTEVSVPPFLADIVARNPDDDSLIVIENQLEPADHTHLGQILTYLAGLQAQTVVWIARGFSEAHLAAVRWLNEHTSDTASFFAIQVKVLRIGDDASSPTALVFDVLEKPSEWERRIRTVEDSRLTALREFRNSFWMRYVQRYPDDMQLRPDHVSPNIFHDIGGLVVSQYLAQGSVGVYIQKSNSKYTEEDHRRIQQCEDSLRETGRRLPVDSNDRNKWPEMIEWLHETLATFRRVIEATPTAEPEADARVD